MRRDDDRQSRRPDEDRDRSDSRQPAGGSPVLLVLLLVGGACFFLLVVAGFVGYAFMARSRAQDAEMRAVLEEQRVAFEEARLTERRVLTAGRTYSRENFQALVDGKTAQEVEDAVGKPAGVESDGPTSRWHYTNRTLDPATGKLDPTVTVTFEAGRVKTVTY